MRNKDYKTTRNRELKFWTGPSIKQVLRSCPGSGVKYDNEDTLRKLVRIREVFPDTPIWNDITKRVKSKKPLSKKQMDAINRTYCKVTDGEYKKYEKRKVPFIYTVSF